MIKEDKLTKQIFLSLIENKYYKDNDLIESGIDDLKAFDSSKKMDKDGKIETRNEGPLTTQENFYTSGFEDDDEIEKKDEPIFKKPLFTTEETIFDDLNYGDFVLICQNPLYHYQIPERIRSLENFIQANKELGKKIKFTKEVKSWLKDLKKYEGINLEKIKVEALFSKYNSKGNQVIDHGGLNEEVIKQIDVKQVKSSVDSFKPDSAWISVKKAIEIYDLCLGCNRGSYFGDGRGDDSYYGLKELDL